MNNSDKPIGIDWNSAPEGATTLEQNGIVTAFCRGNKYYDASDFSWHTKATSYWKVLATRPKPPLTEEQIEIVKDFASWANGYDGIVDSWLKQRGGEHE